MATKIINIDVTGLPEGVIDELLAKTYNLFAQAQLDLPVSWESRAGFIMDGLPSGIVELITAKELASGIELELRTHIEKIGLIELIAEAARASVNWRDTTFDNAEFEHQLRRLIGTLFV